MTTEPATPVDAVDDDRDEVEAFRQDLEARRRAALAQAPPTGEPPRLDTALDADGLEEGDVPRPAGYHLALELADRVIAGDTTVDPADAQVAVLATSTDLELLAAADAIADRALPLWAVENVAAELDRRGLLEGEPA